MNVHFGRQLLAVHGVFGKEEAWPLDDFLLEVSKFQDWANSIPTERRLGEWACAYRGWTNLYRAVLRFVDAVPFANWKPEEVRAVLFTVAGDNDLQHLAREIRAHHPETLVALARAALKLGHRDARWQLAQELGERGQPGGEEEHLLLTLARDESEYVRRRALQSLARLASPAVEELALGEWNRADEDQQWSRMGVLWCLDHVGSRQLAALLAEAERDPRPYLAQFAREMRRGEAKS